MSGGLAPSKSTAYIGNLPFSLTNNDLHKIFERYGKVIKVTVMKDRKTRRSRGVAFVLFLKKEDAQACVRGVNRKQMFGRTLTCSIAKDNGRASEFIRRRNYPDKTQCYECGEEGHLSYKCPKNALGVREPPKKKDKKKLKKGSEQENVDEDDESESEAEEVENKTSTKRKMIEEESASEEEVEPDLETLSAAIQLEQEAAELQQYRYKVATGEYGTEQPQTHRKKIRPDSYFSDEEEVSD